MRLSSSWSHDHNPAHQHHTLPLGCTWAAPHQHVIFILSILFCRSTRSSPLQYLLIGLAHISGMPTSILDLPPELILKIIHSDDSTDATIAYLGMTCRRLHDICQVLVLERQLPVLRALAREGHLLIYKNSGSIAMKDQELGDVKEIFQASFHKIEYAPISFTVKENASVRGLIFHASAVGHINIKLDARFYMLNLPKQKHLCKELASLIRVSSEKDMASLTITGSPFGHSPAYFIAIPKPPPSPPKDNFTIFTIFSPLKDRFFRHKTRSGGSVYFGTPRGLKSFEIHSPLPFLGACFPQTIRGLNGGYLTKLSLSNTAHCGFNWSHILPLLSMPLLSEFNVGDSEIPLRDLSPFLLRHSSITHLDLSCTIPIGPIMPPAGFLPRLEVIRGSFAYLFGLLSRRRHLFPNLRSVALTRDHVGAIHWQRGVLDTILRNLADRKRGAIHLSIEFANENGLTEWFSKAKSKPSSLDCVKTLKIIRFEFRMSSEMCDSFFSWISFFPYVQELDLTQLVPPDSKMWTWRLDALWDSCPELQLIIVGVKTYQRPVKAVK